VFWQKAKEMANNFGDTVLPHRTLIHRGSIASEFASPSKSPLLPSMHRAGNFVPEFPSINSRSRLFSRFYACEASSQHKQSRRHVWLPRMRQRDACWAGELSLRSSHFVNNERWQPSI